MKGKQGCIGLEKVQSQNVDGPVAFIVIITHSSSDTSFTYTLTKF
jgi:hypothetical protein